MPHCCCYSLGLPLVAASDAVAAAAPLAWERCWSVPEVVPVLPGDAVQNTGETDVAADSVAVPGPMAGPLAVLLGVVVAAASWIPQTERVGIASTVDSHPRSTDELFAAVLPDHHHQLLLRRPLVLLDAQLDSAAPYVPDVAAGPAVAWPGTRLGLGEALLLHHHLQVPLVGYSFERVW